ncbi:MAG: hypothetical protein JW860_15320 [Sedimentisphaerales bacterium]|nr:hypothetical protein [Sedimentisphaerales bacterium]
MSTCSRQQGCSKIKNGFLYGIDFFLVFLVCLLGGCYGYSGYDVIDTSSRADYQAPQENQPAAYPPSDNSPYQVTTHETSPYYRQDISSQGMQRNPYQPLSPVPRAGKPVPAGMNEYVVYDPQHPNADEYGNVHLTVRQSERRAGGYMPEDNTRSAMNSSPTWNYQNSTGRDQTLTGAGGYNPYQAAPARDSYQDRLSAAQRPAVTGVSVTEINAPGTDMPSVPKTFASLNSPMTTSPEVSGSLTGTAGAGSFNSPVPARQTANSSQWSTESTPVSLSQTMSNDMTSAGSMTDYSTPAGSYTGGMENFSADTTRDYPALKMSDSSMVVTGNDLTQPALAPHQLERTFGQSINIYKMINDLEGYVSSHPDELKAQLALRLLYSSYGKDERALTHMPSLSGDQSRALTLARAMLLTAQATDPDDPYSAETANQALEALNQLSEQVAEKADLIIPCLKICNKVNGFGQYEEISPEQLQAGQPLNILVYCELQNYKNKMNEEGKYYADLHAEITLFDAGYKVLAQLKEDVTDTPSFNQRHDFFLRGPLSVPQLGAGKYEIVVVIEDKTAGKRARPQRYQFEVK